MGALPKPQEELFVREWVELELTSDPDAREKAYAKAYNALRPCAPNARRKSNQRHVRERFRELFAEALEFRDVRLMKVVTRIDRVARANLADFFEIEPTTKRLVLKDIKALPRELTDALASIEWDDDGRPKIKLWDKNQANFTLLKHMGGVPPEQPTTVNVNTLFAGLSVEDQRSLAEALEALPAGPEPVGADAPREHRQE